MYEYEYEQILVLGHGCRGWSFITCEGGPTFLRAGFSEMNRPKFYILRKWLPHNSKETTNIEATNHTEVHHEYSHIYKINVY